MSLKDACCKTCQQMSACGLPKYRGDGNCDDENNNKDCGYDGGDCCAKTVAGGQVKKNYCKEVCLGLVLAMMQQVCCLPIAIRT